MGSWNRLCCFGRGKQISEVKVRINQTLVAQAPFVMFLVRVGSRTSPGPRLVLLVQQLGFSHEILKSKEPQNRCFENIRNKTLAVEVLNVTIPVMINAD